MKTTRFFQGKSKTLSFSEPIRIKSFNRVFGSFEPFFNFKLGQNNPKTRRKILYGYVPCFISLLYKKEIYIKATDLLIRRSSFMTVPKRFMSVFLLAMLNLSIMMS